jgi:hypothetical protein
VSYFKRGITDPVLDPVKASLACPTGTPAFDDVVTGDRTNKQSFTGDKGTTRSVNVSAISSFTGNRTSDRENKIVEKEDGYDQSKDYSNYHVKLRFYKTGEWDWDVPEARRDTGSNGNRGALQCYFNIMCFDDGDFGSRENGDAAGIARLVDGKEGCV